MTEPSRELKVLLRKIKPRRTRRALLHREPTSKPRRPRVMNKGLQMHTIAKMLERKGISADLVDFRSLIDKRLTLPENIALVSEAVHTPLRVKHYPSEKELLKEQSEAWTRYMRENHLTHYVAYKRDGKTRSDEVGEPRHGFSLIEYINNHYFFGVNDERKESL